MIVNGGVHGLLGCGVEELQMKCRRGASPLGGLCSEEKEVRKRESVEPVRWGGKFEDLTGAVKKECRRYPASENRLL